MIALILLQSLAPLGLGKAGASLSLPMQIAVSLTLLTLLPAAIMCITPFLRITIVLHFLRQALGTQTTPSNQVLIGLSLFLTVVITQPVAMEIYNNAWAPLERGEITAQAAMDRGSTPMKTFLARFVREKDVRLFVEVAKTPAPRTPLRSRIAVLALHHSPKSEDRFSDRRGALPSVSHHRPGSSLHHANDWYGPASPGHGVGAIQDPSVRSCRRMESRRRLTLKELLLR